MTDLPEIEVDGKIAFAGDWHGNGFWARQMIQHCAKRGVKLIMHAGDYGFFFTKTWIKDVEDLLEELGITLIFVDGNHDNHDLIWSCAINDKGFHEVSPHVWASPRGHRWQIWGQSYMGLGGAVSVDRDVRVPMVDWWPTERVTASQVQQAVSGGHVDVMIAHDCPTEVPIPGISFQDGIRYFPAHSLLEAEEHRKIFREVVDAVTPKIYVHGHYHRSYGHVDRKSGTRYIGLDCDGTSVNSNLWIVSELDLHDAGQRGDGDSGD